jgi:hypothetical protein
MCVIETTGLAGPAYDPDMLLALLLYAYSTGQRSSWRIEAACRTDAAHRVTCGDVVRDHATIARFVVDHEHVIGDIFVQVLRLCAAAGLLSVGTVAIDGTKIGSDAALDHNRSAGWIRREVAKILAEARTTDAADSDQPGLFAVDELPEGLSRATDRLERLEHAAALIEAEDLAAAAAAEARAATARAEAAAGRKLRGRKPKDPHAALARAKADETRRARQGGHQGGRHPHQRGRHRGRSRGRPGRAERGRSDRGVAPPRPPHPRGRPTSPTRSHAS